MQASDYINALPDSYQKHSESNNYKLLSLEQRLVAQFRTDIKDVQNTLDIYSASGKTLDLYGSIYGQSRGTSTDEQYRYLVLQKAAQCLVAGDTNSVIRVLATVFHASPTDFGLVETENPCEVKITNLPYTILQNAGLTANQMYEIVASMMPGGVKLAPIELSGTFEFSASADEASNDAGFADIDQTIGGYFGQLAMDNNEVPD